MTVDKLGNNKLLIKLDESDMENFELDFGKMSFKNEDNQKVIIGLMRLACCRAGLDTNGKNVKIEAEKVRQRSVLENGECVGFSECGRGFVPQ